MYNLVTSDSARTSDSMFCIDFVRVTNCFYDYDYDYDYDTKVYLLAKNKTLYTA